MSEVLLSNEVAARLRCSPQWVRKKAEEIGGEMGAFRLAAGGRWRFRKEQFEKWFESQGPKVVEVDYLSKNVSCR